MNHGNILICGAGIAGIAAAYHLCTGFGAKNVVVVDERPPLSLTSDKSTEAYRTFWPGPDGAMVRMMGRSVDILERLARESGNIFNMNRRGYLFATASEKQVQGWIQAARNAESHGAGGLRLHPPGGSPGRAYEPAPAHGYEGQPSGADIITDPDLIKGHFPYLTGETAGIMHVRRAGWLSAQQLGMFLIERFQAAGGQILQDRVSRVHHKNGKVMGVRLENGGDIPAGTFINAAGPYLPDVAAMLGLELPVFNELHIKTSFNDTRAVIPRDAPMVIWSDPIQLDWDEEEYAFLVEDPETRWMTEPLQPSAHFRPDGEGDSDIILMLWEYHTPEVPVHFPIEPDPIYPEMALRGMSKMVPGLKAYLERLPKPWMDGGYYTKTRENRPLACPLPVEGAYLIGAFSGFGIMAAMGMGELLAAHVMGGPLPDYAPAFDLRRYENPEYQVLLENWGQDWQL